MWATDIESNKNIARDRKRKLSYWANIIVIKDAKNPSSEGKVFKYRFGQKIMDKLDAKAQPDEDLGLLPEDFSCVYDGSNFVLKVKKVAGSRPGQFFPNYDDSMFQAPSELFGGDETKLEALEDQLHDLSKIVAPAEFKSVDELTTKLNQVLRISPAKQAPQQSAPQQQATQVQQPAVANDNVDAELDDILGELGL